jgi:citrate synthase
LVTDISYLDPFEGIRYRGYTVDEVLQKLPKPKGAEMPYDEAQFYLLMTGDIPTEQEVQEIIDLFKEKRKVPNYVYKVLDSMPTQARPDVMLAVAVDTMQQESVFAKAYAENKITKQNAWEYMLEDVLNLLPKIPMIAAYIYRLKYKNNNQIPENPDLDFGGNFAHMMGIDKPYDDFLDYILFCFQIMKAETYLPTQLTSLHLLGRMLITLWLPVSMVCLVLCMAELHKKP